MLSPCLRMLLEAQDQAEGPKLPGGQVVTSRPFLGRLGREPWLPVSLSSGSRFRKKSRKLLDVRARQRYIARMTLYRCTDGFVAKTISAASAKDAAEAYAIVTTDVDVVATNVDGDEVGEHQTIRVEIAE